MTHQPSPPSVGELEELARRCEAASGPDRELDASLLEATGGCAHRETRYYCIEDGNDTDSGFTCLRCGKDTYGERVPVFTGSYDAALMLVPNGFLHGYTMYSLLDVIAPGAVQAYALRPSSFVTDQDNDLYGNGEARSPALALCAAALRLRARSLSSDLVSGDVAPCLEGRS